MKARKYFSDLSAIALLAIMLLSMSNIASAIHDTSETTVTSVVDSITVSNEGDGNISWIVDGYSEKGYKVVWSKNTGPTYPTRSGDKYKYFSSPETDSATLTAFDGEGTYFARVCEYLGGECGTYSNEVQLSLSGSTKTEKTVTEDSGTFDDVSETHENSEAIDYLKNEGVVVGYSDGTYKPENKINRAEFLKIVMITAGHENGSEGKCFNDVKEEWYAPYICKAKNMGLVNGYSDGNYRPDRDINFAEASKIVVLALNLPTSDNDNETWYQKFVTSLENKYAIPSTIWTFDEDVTRGEMAEIVWRIETDNISKPSKTYDIIKEQKDTTITKSESINGEVNSITLINEGNGGINWTTDGYSEKGYKVVWSKTSGPTYPTREGDQFQYKSDPSTDSATLDAYDGEGTYYARVCEYLGGECGVYSNEVEVAL
ncbi:hypothetical protein GF366_00505 [Candidatus Peregrinibacteria bacterium]|nr:hypothetical protein [Candidatus Peregrinibacteria bacterium]